MDRRTSTKQFRKQLFGDRRIRYCHYCGIGLSFQKATFDHVIPLSKGGYNKRKNGVIACHPCNQKKGSMYVEDFLKKISGSVRQAETEAEPVSRAAVQRGYKVVVKHGGGIVYVYDDRYSLSQAGRVMREIKKHLSDAYTIELDYPEARANGSI